jgi:hypothetical protein
MNLTNELIAKLIFAVSQLRYFEIEAAINKDDIQLQDIVVKWRAKVDEVLLDMGLKEHIGLNELIEIINL